MISVVIPTYNRLDSLKRVLDALEGQVYPLEKFEVVVVSDGSADGTHEYLRNIRTPYRLKPLVQTNQGPAAARNYGVAKATGELILFIDDDVVPDPHLIREHVRLHNRQAEDVVVIGTMLTPPDAKLAPWVRWSQDRLAEQYQAMVTGQWQPTARQFYTGNTSLPRHLMIESGGFDPVFLRAEDVELAYRLADRGTRFLFNPQAKGFHYEERTFASWLSIPYAYGRYDVVFAVQKGQTWLLEQALREYHHRHLFTRGIVWLGLDRPRLSQAIIGVMKFLVDAGDRLHLAALVRLACSSMFNLRLYQGMADELGGRQLFFNGMRGNLTQAPNESQKVLA
jgi:GT2 family glycosyltransferase